jgi:hypothetical protein
MKRMALDQILQKNQKTWLKKSSRVLVNLIFTVSSKRRAND